MILFYLFVRSVGNHGQDRGKTIVKVDEAFLKQFVNIFETISNGPRVGTGVFFSILGLINTKRSWDAAEGDAGVFINSICFFSVTFAGLWAMSCAQLWIAFATFRDLF